MLILVNGGKSRAHKISMKVVEAKGLKAVALYSGNPGLRFGKEIGCLY